jgi:hypothetical protein
MERTERIRIARLAWCLLDQASAVPAIQERASAEDWLKVGQLIDDVINNVHELSGYA